MINKKVIRKIKLGDKDLKYTLKTSKRARQMRLSVYQDGSLSVTRPWGLNEGVVEKFIRRKADWVIEKIEYFRRSGEVVVPRDNRKHYLKHKEQARTFISERINYYSKLYNCQYRKVSIRNQRTRWGSCSKDGNLNFNYKLMFLPREIADYVIVHELCHLREFNHSREFWDLVSMTMPNHKELRKKLRTGEK